MVILAAIVLNLMSNEEEQKSSSPMTLTASAVAALIEVEATITSICMQLKNVYNQNYSNTQLMISRSEICRACVQLLS